jgi:hypothetical protein
MRYKAKVRAVYPTAKLVTIRCWSDGTPMYQRVVVPTLQAGGVDIGLVLDIHMPDRPYRLRQHARAAWGSAWGWIVRSRREAAEMPSPSTLEEAQGLPDIRLRPIATSSATPGQARLCGAWWRWVRLAQ